MTGTTAAGSDTLGVSDGLVLRTARESEVEQIIELSCTVHGDYEEPGLRHVFADPDLAPDAWLVVVDGSRVVSTSVLLPLPPLQLQLGSNRQSLLRSIVAIGFQAGK